MTKRSLLSLCFLFSLLPGCGSQQVQVNAGAGVNSNAYPKRPLSTEELTNVSLRTSQKEQVLDSLSFSFDKGGQGLSLTDTVDLEERQVVSGSVKEQKYLRLTGAIKADGGVTGENVAAGCMAIELRDNVYFREKTYLRIATTGIYGEQYTEVEVPLLVDMGGWKEIPKLASPMTLTDFVAGSVKKFDGSLCFKIDFTKAPAQSYKGQLVVQYIREAKEVNLPSCNGAASGNCAPLPEGESLPPASEPPRFRCASEPLSIRAGQSREFSWTNPWERALTFALRNDSGKSSNLGELEVLSPSRVKYTAPSRISAAGRVLIAAAPGKNSEVLPQFCEAILIPDTDIGVPDDAEVDGLLGNVYKLPNGIAKLPNFEELTPVSRLVTSNLDIPTRSFSAGFPGVKDLVEWFGISFNGYLMVPASGSWDLQVNSDDGSILYIDGMKVIDNDGQHSPAAKSARISLEQGLHPVRIDYFQGPRYLIALELKWKMQNESSYRIIPADAFTRHLGPAQ